MIMARIISSVKLLVERSIQAHQSNFKVKPRSIRITDSKTTCNLC